MPVSDARRNANDEIAAPGSVPGDCGEVPGPALVEHRREENRFDGARAIELSPPSPDQDEASNGGTHPGGDELSRLAQDAERKSRRSATMSRLLEQHRRHLQSAEKERDEVYAKLARIVPVVQESAASLRDAMKGAQGEAERRRIAELFDVNEKALAELGSLTTTLSADFLWLRSAWEQYTQSLDETRTLS